MKLEQGGKIVIESRYEIDDLIKMIDKYIDDEEYDAGYMDRDELERLKRQLDVLYMTW